MPAEYKTLAIRMTAGYYVGALMRPEATDMEREVLRALAVYALSRLAGESNDGHVTAIPTIDPESFTI